MTIDLLIAGGGPAGYAAALRARAHGRSVTLVEPDAVGGTCLHRGCVPSKAMLHVSATRRAATQAAPLGAGIIVEATDLALLEAHRAGTVRRLHGGLRSLLAGRGVDVVDDRVVRIEPNRLVTASADLEGRNVLVATGSSPAVPDGLPIDGEVVITSDHAASRARLPASVLIVGAGPIGVEFASLWSGLGAASVCLVDLADRILPAEDRDVSHEMARRLGRDGVEIHCGTRVASVRVDGGGAEVVLAGPAGEVARRVELVLVAVGRRPNTPDLGLEELGVLDGQGFVVTDRRFQTAVPGLFAAGDVLAPPFPGLAHAAFLAGSIVADDLAGVAPHSAFDDPALIPRVTYSHPEVVSVGLTEDQARARHASVTTTTETMAGNARALASGESGFVKVVAGDGAIVGLHIVGGPASELGLAGQLLVGWEAGLADVGRLIAAHPTISEVVSEALMAAAGIGLHSIP